jgi:acyl carrier protein
MTPTSIGVRPQAITAIFRRVLESDDVTVDSDFFDVGGDSLLATRVLSAIAREYDVELTFDDFVIAPSPGALAALVESLRP